MKILVFSDAVDNQNAGVHFYTRKLVENFLKVGRADEFTFVHSRKNDFFENTNNFVVPQRKFPGAESYRRLYKIPKLIKKMSLDLVFEPCHIGPFFVDRKIKRAVMLHDLTPIIFPHFHTFRGRFIHKILLGKTLKNADLILTPSENTKNDILKNYETKGNIEVVYLGVDQPKEVFVEGGVKMDFPYILYLGTIEPRKNLMTLIDVFLEMKRINKIPHKLVLAGGVGWKAKDVVKKAKGSPEIIMTGYISEGEKVSWYRGADVFVYPSIYEGFGLPPLEAMSHGVPVVCSTGGSLNEIFAGHALMFDPFDKEKLKEHILKLMSDERLRKKMGEDGKEYAGTFTWENTARKTLEAFRKLI